jgi:hypothetical protein
MSDLYENMVPAYLIEDHPTNKPQLAMKIIESVAKHSGGNGQPAAMLDKELSFAYRNGRRKKTKLKKLKPIDHSFYPKPDSFEEAEEIY